ncbi:hypothetical protein M408DRAFT_22437 [Serendipita vermifera MAFF 305830]|uniref:AAA+ ATPase domain-containing protein n=1 Tax=Serendipita vermifera MAFF 305830 TaxID=933852 RepID=A0A0C3AZR8_SERVB|nr:hypothetical protein M408DRAFT_22437 [Serendipita vermifera MAFF 305830]
MSSSLSAPLNDAERESLKELLGKLKALEVRNYTSDESELLARQLFTNSHWYCHRTTELTREVAACCQQWLVATDNQTERVVKWDKRHQKVLNTCVDCVRGMEDALLASQSTYLSNVKKDRVERYFGEYNKWNATRLINHLEQLDDGAGIDQLHPAQSYHLFYNPALTGYPGVWPLLKNKLPSETIQGWPQEAPPGIIALLLFNLESIKDWADTQLDAMKLPPEVVVPAEDNHYRRAYDGIVTALASTGGLEMDISTPYIFREIFNGLDSVSFWASFPATLKRFPDISSSCIVVADEKVGDKGRRTNLMGILVNHLSRYDEAFPFVLETFETILQLFGSDAWRRKSPQLPRIALHAIKDNKAFSSVNAYKNGAEAKSLGWIEPFIKSVMPLDAYSEILHEIFQIFLEQLQHESMRAARHVCLTYFFSAITRIHQFPLEGNLNHREAIIEATNIHLGIVIAIAFGKDFSGSEWKTARKYARSFMLAMLGYDIEQIQVALKAITPLETGKGDIIPKVSTSYQRLWDGVRKALLPNDIDGYEFFLQVVAKSALVTPMDASKLLRTMDPSARAKAEALLKTVNHAISVIHKNFDQIVLGFLGATKEQDMTAFCDRATVGPVLVTLLLSPIKQFSEGAQNLVGQAYNADERGECIRALLEKHCETTLSTMTSQLDAFNKATTELPETVDAAKMLVKCYTDILNELCAIDRGLLFSEKFKTRSKGSLRGLLPLWKSMCNAAGIIIDRTPDWANRYHSGDMTPWMRDALIFASELMDKRRVFESALAISFGSDSSSQENGLVDDFAAIMRPLGSWLRLSHQELLDLSYKLLMDLLNAFKETRKQPEDSLLQHMERSIRKLGKGTESDANAKLRTKLSAAQLGTLMKLMGSLKGLEDSDVEFVSQTFSPKKVSIRPAAPRPQVPLRKPVHHAVIPKAQSVKAVPPALSKGKAGNLMATLQKGASIGIPPRGLNSAMVQRAIEERKAAKPRASTGSLASSSGGEHESSNSESDSDEDGAPSGLAQLSKLQKSPIKQQRQERRRAILLNGTAMSPRTGQINQTAGTEVRRQIPKQQVKYIPDMTPLHRIILSWNYDHDGPEPQTNGGPLDLKPVPDSFLSYRHYLDVMHPLFIVECWNSLIKSKEESIEKVQLVIAGKMHADFWVEVDVVIDQSVPKGWMLFETDIVLMEHAAGRKTLAKVHSARQTRQGIQATIRYSAELGDMDLDRAMAIQSSWMVSRVFNLSTAHREYAALMGMHHYDWADAVYKPHIGTPAVPTESQIRKAMVAHKLNHPQAKAVLSSLETTGFSLIQGPPGTGKTSTICGLVGVFMSTRRAPVTSVQPGKAGTKVSIPRKVLVCAPSNAAIDEVARRLKDGVWKSDGSKVAPNVVRLGADASINVSVKDISLDQLVEELLSKTNSKNSEVASEVANIREQLSRVKQLREEKTEEMQSSKTSSSRIMELERELKELASKRISLSSRLTAAQDMGREASRAVDSARRKARMDVLNGADVVCCTLSGSGHDVIEQFEFDLVIIDEAAQAIELSSLIPLKFSSDRCIMVGAVAADSDITNRYKDEDCVASSLFVRLQISNPSHVHLLSIQYRMHPEISRLPSALFYDGKLTDGPGMQEKTAQPWHSNDKLGIFKFFDVSGQEVQADMGHSQYNMAEVNVAAALYAKVRRDYPSVNLDYRIGIISMYRAQLAKLRTEFSSRWGKDILSKIDFNTVDGFQGQEKDIIILSCVRAGPNITSIGFLSDARRMNVAITRSRSSLFILGNASTLKRSNQLWEQIVGNAQSRNLLVPADSSFFASSHSFSHSKAPVPPKALPTSSPKRVINKPEVSKSMKPLTPKEWKALNEKKKGEALDQGLANGQDGIESKQFDLETGNAASKDPANLSREGHLDLPAGNNRKRGLSDLEQPLQPPPALRQASSVPVAGTSNHISGPVSHVATGQPKPQKPPPKPKGSNLFIPKKPAVKRPLPSDAPMPDPKRRPV